MAYFGNRKKRVESSDKTPGSGALHGGGRKKVARGRTERQSFARGHAARITRNARRGRS